MRLSELKRETPEVSPFLYVLKNGTLFKVYRSNYDGTELSDTVLCQQVKRMWTYKQEPRCALEPDVITIRLSSGYEVLSPHQAYDVYELTHGFAKRLAGDASESPNYIRQINDIDS